MLEGAEVRLAVDIGGTFTDIVLDVGQDRKTRKVLTTPRRPEQAVLDGMRLILTDARAHMSDIDVFIHGTTLATNAIIERRGAKTALIATNGFRDVLDIGTESRYDQYDLSIDKPRPLAPRSLRFTVPERIDAHGAVRLPLDEAAVRALAPKLRALNVESVAIAFLHSYANPEHERRTAAILSEEMPGISVTVSSAVCPEIREYERTSTAVANAYVQPLIDGYLARMADALQVEQFRGAIYLVTSGGGVTSIETARRFPVRLVESGPAGGAIFAAQIAARLGESKVLSFDMGGTTAKICLIEKYQPETSRVFEVDRAARFLKGSGLPVRIPVIEMVEIGAGSIAHVDAMKRVTVGPESASSEPGPACYGRGGQRPAVTDADVALGMIDPDAFAGGTIKLSPELSKAALLRAVGEPLGLSAETAAYAVHEVVCENMASAARVHAVERGEIVGQHTLIAFGGAAPLHAARVAEKIGVSRVIVPSNAGVGSAVGFLAAPIAYELVRSRHVRLDDFDTEGVSELLQEMVTEARAQVEPGAAGAPVRERRAAFMRYVGQGHEISVELPNRRLTSADLAGLRQKFEADYSAMFERPIPGAAIEVLSWSVLATTDAHNPSVVASVARKPAGKASGSRKFFDGRAGEVIEIPLYRREDMAPGATIAGPTVIAEDETSTFVSNSFDAHIDGAGSIVMERKAA
ncbi:hydantoinase/oxoprolinase family protein [Bradyrhizobium barranii subsp. apii]|uniref:hydantoinase/oxoprolinase family protein n=1 Tax=Bradyrhizobium barranii TaxID=2992140 RepID=UPI001AA0C9DC|nr:hydantoinase/oxoprolinase family protein [Bradyrhizobium barranii]UPT98947.1 hydantoinase/oxoprolinase family protein [Bradyrhizobium barranii subsp. apii]